MDSHTDFDLSDKIIKIIEENCEINKEKRECIRLAMKSLFASPFKDGATLYAADLNGLSKRLELLESYKNRIDKIGDINAKIDQIHNEMNQKFGGIQSEIEGVVNKLNRLVNRLESLESDNNKIGDINAKIDQIQNKMNQINQNVGSIQSEVINQITEGVVNKLKESNLSIIEKAGNRKKITIESDFR